MPTRHRQTTRPESAPAVPRMIALAVAGALVAASAVVLGPLAPEAEAAIPTYSQPATGPSALQCTASTGILVSTGSGASDISTATVTNGVFSKTTVSSLNELVNAIGYNPNDGLIYGMTTSSTTNGAGTTGTDNQFVRFDLTGKAHEQYLGIPALADGTQIGVQYDAGVIASNNTWIGFARNTGASSKTNGSLYMEKVVIPAAPATSATQTIPATQLALTFASGTTAFTQQPRDVSFNPFDGLLYTLMPDGFIYSINPSTALVTKVTTTAVSNATWAGGSWTDSFGNIFFFQNGSGSTGRVYQFVPSTKAITDVGAATAYSDFDATACTPAGLQKTVSPSTILPNTTATFTFSLANPYGSEVDLTGFSDTLASGTGLTWVDGSVSATSTTELSGTTTYSGRSLSISKITLAPGEKYTFTAKAKVTSTPTSGQYTNQAQVSNAGATILSDDPNQVGNADPTPFTVNLPTPTANADTPTTSVNTPVTFTPTTNDTDATTGGGTIDPTKTTLLDSAGSAATTVSTADGTYTLSASTGSVTFTPANDFSGTAAVPVSYRITDSNGATATSTITPTVGPKANDDSASTNQGSPVTIPATSNDIPKSGTNKVDVSTVTFSNGEKSITVPNQGTFVANIDGTVTFTPVASFTGTAQTTYTVTSSTGLVSNPATISVAVAGVPPKLKPDTATTQENVAVSLSPLDNDAPGVSGGAALRPSSLKFAATNQPSGSSLSGDALTLTVPGQGVYVADPSTGKVAFTPEPGYSGTATSVRYQVTDENNLSSTASITVTVTPVSPTAVPDTASTAQNTPVTLNPLANDQVGNSATPLVTGSVKLTAGQTGATPTDGGKTLVVDGEGTYTVADDGKVTFTPEPLFGGTATPIGYTVAASDGKTAASTITVTVSHAAPQPTADAGSGLRGDAIDLGDVLANDATGAPGVTAEKLDPATFTFLALTSGGTVSGDGLTLEIDGVGTFTAVRGTDSVDVTFTPAETDPGVYYEGDVPTVGYSVSDNSSAAKADRTASSTIDVAIEPTAPEANDDSATTPENTPVDVRPLANDIRAQGGTALQGSTFAFLDGDGDSLGTGVDRVEVAGGVYTVDRSGESPVVTFSPDAGFVGDAPSIAYTVSDDDSQATTATIRITVAPVAPVATPDSDATSQDVPVTVDPLANDAGASGIAQDSLDRDSVVLGVPSGSGGTLSADKKTLTITGVGTWVVSDGSAGTPAGAVTFTPAAGYTTDPQSVVPPAVPYTVTDLNGLTASSTITITVSGVTPVATNDRATTTQGTAITLDALANDAAGSSAVPLVASTFAFGAVGSAQPSADKLSITLSGVGTFRAVPATDGSATVEVTFTPVPAYSGLTTALPYTVADKDGSVASANIRITVTAVPPTAVDDERSTPQNTAITFDPTANDEAGLDGDGTPLDRSSVVFTSTGLPADAELSTDHRTLTLPGQGVYTVGSLGTVTFTPADGFAGSVSPVIYQISDGAGQSDTAVIDMAVTPAKPTEKDVTGSTAQDKKVTVSLSATPGNASTPIVWSTAKLGSVGDDEPSADGTSLTVTGEGTYVLTTTSTGATVVFTPAKGYSGTASSVPYTVEDSAGNVASGADITITVTPVVPTASPDEKSTPQNTPVTVQPLGNDDAGRSDIPLDPATVRLRTLGANAPTDDGLKLTVPGEGTYSVNATNGLVTFTPAQGFHGVATPVTYQVADADGTVATSTIRITVTGVTPSASNDVGSTKQGAPVTIDPLRNDTAGGAATPLDATTVQLTTKGLKGATLSDDGRTLKVPGEGTYTVDAKTGAVTFAPLTAFVGVATPVTYTVADVDGQRASATITISVPKADQVARADIGTTKEGDPITIDPLTNDTAPSGAAWDTRSVILLLPAGVPGATLSADARTLTIPGEGVYTVDPVTGKITFTPEDGFTGTATPIQYSVADVNGVRSIARVSITVTGAAANPIAAGLAFTGSDTGRPLTIGFASLLAGLGLVVVSRRRRRGGLHRG